MQSFLKNIAKQWKSISFNEFKAIYNKLKIVKPQDMVKLSKAKIADNEILIMAIKRHDKPSITLADLMREIKSINARLDKHEEMFRVHGWMK